MLFLNGLIFSQESGKCVAGDCENGEGTWIWDHGDKFEGYWEQGLYIDGVYSYKNGDEYEGTFKDSMKHGVGTMNWNDGRQYTGGWKNGLRDGYGIFFFPNEDRYEGEFKDNLFNGKGTYFWAGEEEKYEGEFKDHLFHGQGVMTKKEYIDKGTWKNDVRHGVIETYTLNNVKVYEVEYLDGLINGYTRLYNQKGEVIKEEFLNDESGDDLVTKNNVYFSNGSYEVNSDSRLTMCTDESFVFYFLPAPKDEKYFSEMLQINPFHFDDLFLFKFCSERVFVDTKQPVTGVVYETYSNGNIKYTMIYKNGKHDGKYNLCYDFNGENLGLIKAKKTGKKVKTNTQGSSGWTRKTVRIL